MLFQGPGGRSILNSSKQSLSHLRLDKIIIEHSLSGDLDAGTTATSLPNSDKSSPVHFGTGVVISNETSRQPVAPVVYVPADTEVQ